MKTCSKFLSGTLLALLVAVIATGCSNPSDPTPDPKTPKTYTVTFNANAGDASVSALPAAITGIEKGAKITEPAAAPAREGFTFGGWFTTAECETQWNFTTNTVNKDLTLYAYWLDDSKEYVTINFDTGDSKWVIPEVKKEKGTVVDVLNAYEIAKSTYDNTDPGFEASGIYDDITYSKALKDNSTVDYYNYKLNADIIFFIEMSPRFLITLDANGGKFDSGELLVSEKVRSSEQFNPIFADNKPTRDKFDFKGWSRAANSKVLVGNDEIISEAVTLYAVWYNFADSVKGFWVRDTPQDSQSFFYLEADGTGYKLDYSVNKVTFDSTKLNLSGDGADFIPTFSEDGSTFTVTYNGSGQDYKRPSATNTKTPGGDLPAGKYSALATAITLADGGVLEISSLKEHPVLKNCKWASDTDSFFVLNSDNMVLLQIPITKVTEYTDGGLGGFYYNYTDSTGKFSYSVYLNENGDCEMDIWGQKIAGSWSVEQMDSVKYINISDGVGEFPSKYEFTLTDKTLTIGAEPTFITFAQSATNGTVSAFSGNSAVYGTWKTPPGEVIETVTFNSLGLLEMTSSGNAEPNDNGDFSMFYSFNGEKLMVIQSDSYTPFSLPQSLEYTLDGSVFNLMGTEFTKQ